MPRSSRQKEKARDNKVEFKIGNLEDGANNVSIEVKDGSGNYVTDAKVNIKILNA